MTEHRKTQDRKEWRAHGPAWGVIFASLEAGLAAATAREA